MEFSQVEMLDSSKNQRLRNVADFDGLMATAEHSEGLLPQAAQRLGEGAGKLLGFGSN